MIIAAPGETLRPGIPATTEADGKTGTPSNQQAGVGFNGTAYATDQYFNPIANGPFPTINFNISPTLAGSFIGEPLPINMASGLRTVSIFLQSSSNIQIVDQADPLKTQTVSVPIAAGPLHHFVMSNVGTQTAGNAFTVTITGQDQFNNTISATSLQVNLTPNTGAGTMSPTQVTLTNGVWTGNLTMFAATATAHVTMSTNGQPNASRNSNDFRIDPQAYSRLLLLLPGETIAQGTAIGKTGTPSPAQVGAVSLARAIATDLYYNPVNITGNTVELTSNHYAVFGTPNGQGQLQNVDGHGEFSTTFLMRTATTHTVTLRDVNLSAIAISTSGIVGTARPYRRLQLVAPGEAADPGTFALNGKTVAPPTDQPVSTPFNVTILAVDDYWNPTTFSGGDMVFTSSPTTTSFNPPNNPFQGPTPRQFVNGTATRGVILGQQGVNDIRVFDQNDLTKTDQIVSINAIPGAIFTIQSPVQATAGQPFAPVTITLTNNGVPVPGNRQIYLSADLASGGPASGSFNSAGTEQPFTMINGTITITGANALIYAHCERIRIKLRDDFNRVAYSSDIEVIPSGLKYRIIVPTFTVVAGPPSP
jgi:hypothetical protein